jgi:hypothetical protein
MVDIVHLKGVYCPPLESKVWKPTAVLRTQSKLKLCVVIRRA